MLYARCHDLTYVGTIFWLPRYIVQTPVGLMLLSVEERCPLHGSAIFIILYLAEKYLFVVQKCPFSEKAQLTYNLKSKKLPKFEYM